MLTEVILFSHLGSEAQFTLDRQPGVGRIVPQNTPHTFLDPSVPAMDSEFGEIGHVDYPEISVLNRTEVKAPPYIGLNSPVSSGSSRSKTYPVETPSGRKLSLSLSSSHEMNLKTSHGSIPLHIFCQSCGKHFTELTKYRAHEAYHARAGRYPCSYCSKAFHCKEHVARHERIHTGERPFKCQYCEKSYTRKNICRMHEDTHFKNLAS